MEEPINWGWLCKNREITMKLKELFKSNPIPVYRELGPIPCKTCNQAPTVISPSYYPGSFEPSGYTIRCDTCLISASSYAKWTGALKVWNDANRL